MGRKTSFKPEYIERGKALCEAGALDRDLAQVFGCAISTLYVWRHQFPEFAEALKRSKEVADDAVEMALFRKATGYSYDSEKIFCHEGEVTRVPTVEHVPPSDTAMIFWLKNRRSDQWRDKTEQDVNVKDLAEIIAARRRKMTDGQ